VQSIPCAALLGSEETHTVYNREDWNGMPVKVFTNLGGAAGPSPLPCLSWSLPLVGLKHRVIATRAHSEAFGEGYWYPEYQVKQLFVVAGCVDR